MKKFTFLLSLLFTVVSLHAQDYQISFAASGTVTTVETVFVENQTQGKSLSLLGSETLHLMAIVTGNAPILDNVDFPLHIYPNPSLDYFTIEFGARKSSPVTIKLFDLTGREITNLKQTLSSGIQSFRVSGLNYGIFTIKVDIVDQSYSGKLISQGSSNSQITIKYLGNKGVAQDTTKLKNATTERFWQYNAGDILKITGISGNVFHEFMDVPTESKILTFNFPASLPTNLPRRAYTTVGKTYNKDIEREIEVNAKGLQIVNVQTSGTNRQYFSIPADKTLTVRNQIMQMTYNKTVPDNRVGYANNFIWQSSNYFATANPTTFFITIE